MKYKNFGKTGLQVSEVGFGCGRVGGLLLGDDMAAKRLAIRKALDHGINWFDTAEMYGTEAELGRLLAEAGADPHVSTKISLDPKAPDLAAQVEAKAAAGLARLGRDHVTVLQIHNRTDDAGDNGALTADQMLGPVADGLDRLRRAGVAQFFGFTALGETGAILKVIGSGKFNSVQVYYNLVNPSAARAMPPTWHGQSFTGVLDEACARGMGVLAIRVLDGGIIATDERIGPFHMMARETSETIEVDRTGKGLAALGAGLGTRPQIGVRFALSCPSIDIALVGIGDPTHVDSAAQAAGMGPLPAEAIARLEPLYERNFQ